MIKFTIVVLLLVFATGAGFYNKGYNSLNNFQVTNEKSSQWHRESKDDFSGYTRMVTVISNPSTNKLIAVRLDEWMANDSTEWETFRVDNPKHQAIIQDLLREYEVNK